MTDTPTPTGTAPDPAPAPAPQAPADGVSMADLKAVADLAGTGARLLQAETALSIDALRHATAYGVLAGLMAGGALLSLLLALAYELRQLLGGWVPALVALAALQFLLAIALGRQRARWRARVGFTHSRAFLDELLQPRADPPSDPPAP
jgi:hypothetical protein